MENVSRFGIITVICFDARYTTRGGGEKRDNTCGRKAERTLNRHGMLHRTTRAVNLQSEGVRCARRRCSTAGRHANGAETVRRAAQPQQEAGRGVCKTSKQPSRESV